MDALQYLSGCTFGKGNLIFKDYGKHVFTLYNRDSRKGARVAFNARNVPEDILKDREEFINWLLSAPEEEVISLQEVRIDEPEPARIVDSVVCESCGEMAMATRTRKVDGKTVCAPCSEKHQTVL